MRNDITPYFAVTPRGNIVYVSEFNDECSVAEVKLLHAYQGRARNYNAGDAKVVRKRVVGLFTAVSVEVATNLLTIKRGVLPL